MLPREGPTEGKTALNVLFYTIRCARARAWSYGALCRKPLRWPEMDAMTVLALIAAILEFASSLLGFLTAIVERLPIRKDKEP